MSALGEVYQALKKVTNVVEDVKRVGDALKEISVELNDHDRRINRLEAKWETMMEIAAIQQAARVKNLVEKQDA